MRFLGTADTKRPPGAAARDSTGEKSASPRSTDETASLEAGEVNVIALDGTVVNSSGHRDQLQRNYGFWSICGLALTVDNAWVAVSTSLTVAISNGGPPGVLYEFLVAFFYYSFIGASLAELASSVPSAGGIYHWASLTPGPRHGRLVGYLAGWINFFGWIFDLASISYVMAQLVVQMYALYHPGFSIEPWHLYVSLVAITWLCVACTVFFNRFLPYLQHFGLFMVLFGGVVSIIVVVSMNDNYASNEFVWTDWENATGWPDGLAFLAGVLNGAFTIGTCDAPSHVSEELPDPKRDVPRAIAAQLTLGAIYAFSFAIAILYGISDLQAVIESPGSFPLAAIYLQATQSRAATFGLLFIVFLCLVPCLIGTYVTVGRTLWALARDHAIPFSTFFALVNERLSCPIPATVLSGLLTTAFCAITLGSRTAFSDLVGSFVILTTTSYVFAVLPHLLTGRRNVPPGPFHMGRAGYVVNALMVALVCMFNVIYCFPYTNPTSVESMNYNSVILVGVVVLAAVWWVLYARRHYRQPLVAVLFFEKGGGVRSKT